MVLLMVGVALVAAFSFAEEKAPDPIEVLQKVDAAVKAVDSVKLSIMSEGSGAATNPPAEGEAIMAGWSGNTPELFYAHVKTKRRDTEEDVEYTGGGNGDMFFLIDHTSKKAYEDMDPAVIGSAGNALFGIAMMEFVHNAPFDDELNADSVEYLGMETVSGEECYKIDVKYSGGRGHSVWYFSEKDFLPRRRDIHFTNREGEEGTVTRIVTSLDVNPKINDDMFTMNLPEGYEQIDDFAP
jgi:outer membrane lipoprotein-sorting protein